MSRIAEIQAILAVDADGIWGPKSQAALDALIANRIEHHVIASSFADPLDITAFRRCKEQGRTDKECFRLGDNGIGWWDDDTSEGSGPSCALPPEDMEGRWGSVNAAAHKNVLVQINGALVTCVLKDRMPHRANITNGAGIDLNPDALAAVGLQPPIMLPAVWSWV